MRNIKANAKAIFMITLLCAVALALASCNLDADDGIYSEVVDSHESKNVNMISYLGKDSSDAYYYLTDTGIYRTSTSGALVANKSGKIIQAAYLDESTGDLNVLIQDVSTSVATLYYYAVSGTSYADPVTVHEGINNLLTNGICYDSENVYSVSGSTLSSALVSNVSVIYPLVTDEYTFLSVNDTSTDTRKYYVIKDGSVQFSLEGSTSYVAFQPVGTSGNYILITYNSDKNTYDGHLMTSSSIDSTVLFKLKSALSQSYGSQAASFYYTDADSDEYMVIKCTGYFDKYNITDDTIEQVKYGFANTLRTTNVTNIISTDDNGVVIVGTEDSLLYKVDMLNDKTTSI